LLSEKSSAKYVTGPPLPVHIPALHTSIDVQPLPSLHGVPLALKFTMQPIGVHTPTVHSPLSELQAS
jgi:hypothetical protein